MGTIAIALQNRRREKKKKQKEKGKTGKMRKRRGCVQPSLGLMVRDNPSFKRVDAASRPSTPARH